MRCLPASARVLSAATSFLAFMFAGIASTCAMPGIARAQTVTFSGAQSTIPTSSLNQPVGIAVDQNGNIYIADSDNYRVLKETLSGGRYTESTIATLQGQNEGIAVDSKGNVYFGDNYAGVVHKATPSGSDYILSVIPTSPLNVPVSVAVDATGNLYIADLENNRVLKETLSGGSYTESTLGTGLQGPRGVAVDAHSNVYIVDTGNDRILKETYASGAYTQSVVASGLGAPWGIAADAAGNVYVADPGNSRALKETLTNGAYVQSTIPTTQLDDPLSIAVDSNGAVYIAEPDTTNRILKESSTLPDFGTVDVASQSPAMTLFFTFTAGGSTIGSTSVVTQGATGLDFTDSGTGSCTTNGPSHVYQAGDTCTMGVVFKPRYSGVRYGAVLLNDNSGNPLATTYLLGTGFGPQAIFPPGTQTTVIGNGPSEMAGIVVDGSGNLYVAALDQVLKEIPLAGGYTQSEIIGGLGNLEGIALDGAGNIYVISQFSNHVSEYIPTANGYRLSVNIPIVGVPYPTGLAVDESGDVYVVDNENGGPVMKETLSNGSYTQSTVANNLVLPESVAVDSVGNVYVGDIDPNSFGEDNTRILKLTPSNGLYAQNTIITGLGLDWGLTFDGNGNLFVTENLNGNGQKGTIYKETPSGNTYTQTVVCNNLIRPRDSAVDGNGNLYVVMDPDGIQQLTSQLVKIDLSDAPPVHFAATAVGQTSSNSPQAATIENNGNAPLSFEIPDTGSNPALPSGFTLGGASTCPEVSSGAASPGTLAAGASCNYSISFSPQTASDTSGWMVLTDDALNAAAPAYATQSIPLVVAGAPITPAINWANPASIVYGTALSGLQLNARTNVPGSFSYSPALGTVVGGGSQTLTATFTPTDTVDFKSASASVTLVVTPATPTITWGAPATITYGSALGAAQLDATASVPGTFSYSPAAGTVLGAGTQTLSVTFTPTDATDYTTATASVILTVNRAAPPIVWATPAPITYGTALSATQFDASSTVAGAFSYSPAAGTVLGGGTQTLSVTFTPTDTTDYTTATTSVLLTVNQATPGITWSAPAAITYGTALGAAQLNATAAVPGTFSYSPAAGTALSAGTQTLSATFYPADSTDYKVTTATVALQVSKAAPVVGWATPAAISYGTALGAAQLDAAATGAGVYSSSAVGGSFVYSPAAGAVLNAGTQTLSTTFTPTDTADYTTATGSVTLTVNTAAPAITWATPAAITYGTALGAAQLNASSTVAGTFTYSPSAGAVLTAGAQTLTATFAPTDTADYKSSTATVVLTVNQAVPTITWTDPIPITYGYALGNTQLNAIASIAGSFAYNPPAGTLLAVGEHALTATFTPADATDYTTATATVNLWVDNPYPLISNTSPFHVAAGSGGFTLTVNGTGFMPSSTIYWGNTGLTTTYVSSTQLTAPVSATQVASAGTAAVTVQTGTPGGGTSNSFQFEIDSANSGSAQVTISTTTAVVAAGSTASYTVTIPSDMTGVSVACLNLPAGASCTYTAGSSAVTVSTAANTPTGTYAITVVFTGQIPATGSAGWILAPFLLIPLWLFRKRANRSGLWMAVCVLLLAVGSVVIGGCGGGGGSSGGGGTTTPQTVQVTTSGGVSLTIQ